MSIEKALKSGRGLSEMVRLIVGTDYQSAHEDILKTDPDLVSKYFTPFRSGYAINPEMRVSGVTALTKSLVSKGYLTEERARTALDLELISKNELKKADFKIPGSKDTSSSRTSGKKSYLPNNHTTTKTVSRRVQRPSTANHFLRDRGIEYLLSGDVAPEQVLELVSDVLEENPELEDLVLLQAGKYKVAPNASLAEIQGLKITLLEKNETLFKPNSRFIEDKKHQKTTPLESEVLRSTQPKIQTRHYAPHPNYLGFKLLANPSKYARTNNTANYMDVVQDLFSLPIAHALGYFTVITDELQARKTPIPRESYTKLPRGKLSVDRFALKDPKKAPSVVLESLHRVGLYDPNTQELLALKSTQFKTVNVKPSLYEK